MADPKKKKTSVGFFVAILLIAIVAAAVVLIWSPQSGEPAASPTPDPAVTGTVTPATPPATPAETASPPPTATPTPTPPPTAEPSPTPEPTPTPTPDIQNSGSFHSNTGTGLELIAEWYVTPADGGAAAVTVTLFVESYSLECAEVWNGAALEIGGATYAFTTAAVSNEGPDVAKNELGSITVDVPLDPNGGLELPAEIRWHFDGTYGGEELAVITASGVITG